MRRRAPAARSASVTVATRFHLGVAQRAVGLEAEPEREALLGRGERRAPVDVEQAQNGEQVAAGAPDERLDRAAGRSSGTTIARSRSTAWWRDTGRERTTGGWPPDSPASASSATRMRSGAQVQRGR